MPKSNGHRGKNRRKQTKPLRSRSSTSKRNEYTWDWEPKSLRDRNAVQSESMPTPARETRFRKPNKNFFNDTHVTTGPSYSTGSSFIDSVSPVTSQSNDLMEAQATIDDSEIENGYDQSEIVAPNSDIETESSSSDTDTETLADSQCDIKVLLCDDEDRDTLESVLMIDQFNGSPFLQHFACWKIRELSKCRDCSSSEPCEANVDMELCRFFNFRKLRYDKDEGAVFIVGFADVYEDPTEDDIQLWLSNIKAVNLPDLKTACFIYEQIYPQFHALIKVELDILFQSNGYNKVFDSPDYLTWDDVPCRVKWKRKTPMVREMCDVCETTIFNHHWACASCGFIACISCRMERKKYSFIGSNYVSLQDECQLVPVNLIPGHAFGHRDVYRWFFCWNTKDSRPDPHHEMLLVQFIPAKALEDISKWNCNALTFPYHNDSEFLPLKKLKLEFQPQLDNQIAISTRSSSRLTVAPHDWYCDGMLLHLHDPQHPRNATLFHNVWIRGQPVLVSGLSKTLSKSLWTPKAFEESAGETTHELVDIATGKPKVDSLRKFWQGFENIDARLKNEKNEPMLLKLKDWPPKDDLANAFPERFEDLMNNLPLPEYTLRDGKYNLAARLPESFLKPDLGPKMYIAYASPHNVDLGTTNLHLDMSDATNVICHVGIPHQDGRPIPNEWQALMKVITDEEFDAKQITRIRSRESIPGAIWHIYHKDDAGKIREYLRKYSFERGCSISARSDPIHDQRFYLDLEMRKELKAKYGVLGYPIIQCMGDAVFIPAGAPHQVRNIRSCIKIAEDFVSPENLSNCFHLTEEFRQLSDNHNNHEDKLQIKNITFHAMKDAISVLRANGLN